MLSSTDKLILENLKTTNPEAYDLFIRTEAEHKEVVKRGCHDVRNIITVISGAYQLLDLTNKDLSALPRWNQLGKDIKYLIEAFNRIGCYRYADNVTLTQTSVSELTQLLNEYSNAHYPDNCFIYSLQLSQSHIITDGSKLFEALAHLIDNAAEAVNIASDLHSRDITLSIAENKEPHMLEIVIGNCCHTPDAKIIHNITEPFISNKSNRIGLGLSIAARTIDALKGSLLYDFSNNYCTVKIAIPYNC